MATMKNEEFQQNTSNLGGLKRPTIQALYNGQNMHLNLYKKKWNHGFKNMGVEESKKATQGDLKEIARLSKDYGKWIEQENKKSLKEFGISSVGKIDPKRHLKEVVGELKERVVLQNFGFSINSR